MNILKYFKSLITPAVRCDCDGMYYFVHLECEEDIKKLQNQINLIPDQPGIDNKWISDSLNLLSNNPKSIKQFIETYQKIEIGKDLNYKDEPEEFVKQLKIMYPNVKWNGLKAIGGKLDE